MRELKPHRNEKYDLWQLAKAWEEDGQARWDFSPEEGRFIQGIQGRWSESEVNSRRSHSDSSDSLQLFKERCSVLALWHQETHSSLNDILNNFLFRLHYYSYFKKLSFIFSWSITEDVSPVVICSWRFSDYKTSSLVYSVCSIIRHFICLGCCFCFNKDVVF